MLNGTAALSASILLRLIVHDLCLHDCYKKKLLTLTGAADKHVDLSSYSIFFLFRDVILEQGLFHLALAQ